MDLHNTIDKGYAWIVALCGMGLIILQGSLYSVYAVIFIELVEYYDTTKSVVSWIGAIQQLLFGLSGILLGPLIAKYGARKVGITTPWLVVLGYIGTAFSTHLWIIFIAFGVSTGVGLGCFGILGISCSYPWFSKRRTLALSIIMTGVPIGSFLWPPFVTWLMHVYSWRGALIICAGVHLQAVVLIALIGPPDKPCNNTPTETNGSQDRKNISMDSISDGQMEPFVDKTVQRDKKQNQESKRLSDWLVLFKDITFPLIYLGMSLSFAGHITAFAYSTARGILFGYSDTDSAFLTSILGVSGGLGRTLSGLLGNTFGDMKMLVCGIAMVIAGTASVISNASSSYWFLACYSAFVGLPMGFYSIYILSGPPDLYEPKYAAEMSGLVNACGGMSFFITNIFIGILLDKSSNPSLPFVVFGSVQCLGGIIVLVAAWLKRTSLHKSSKLCKETHVSEDVHT